MEEIPGATKSDCFSGAAFVATSLHGSECCALWSKNKAQQKALHSNEGHRKPEEIIPVQGCSFLQKGELRALASGCHKQELVGT